MNPNLVPEEDTRTPEELLDIIEAAEGDARRQTCVLTGKPCGRGQDPCDVHEMFYDAQEAILARLDSTSVAEVVAGDADAPGGVASS